MAKVGVPLHRKVVHRGLAADTRRESVGKHNLLDPIKLTNRRRNKCLSQ